MALLICGKYFMTLQAKSEKSLSTGTAIFGGRSWPAKINMPMLIHCLAQGCANHATEGKCFCPPSAAVT